MSERGREPAAERVGVTRIQREVFLRALPLARPTGAAARQLAARMEDVRLPAGALVYRAGEPPEAAYFVVSGEVSLEAPGLAPRRFGPDSAVGVVDLMADRPRARTARVVEAAHLLRLRAEDWIDVLEDDFEYTRSSLRAVADSSARLRLAMLPDGGFPPPPADVAPARADEPELGLLERMVALRETELLSRASMQAITVLAEGADEIRLPAGELLSERVSLFPGFLVVARGVVEVAHESIVARFGPGTVAGGPLPLCHPPRTLAVRGVVDAALLHVREEDFFDVMEDHFDLARSVFRTNALDRERVVDAHDRRRSDAPPAPDALDDR